MRKRKIVRRVRPRVVVSVGHGEALREIVRLAREWEWDLLDLALTRGSLPTDPAPSGAVVSCLPTDPLAIRLRGMDCPAVRLGSLPHPQDHLLPAVLLDRAAQGRLAADHFAERGFKHAAYLGHDPWSDFQVMYEGFRGRGEERGMKCHLHQLKSARLTADESDSARYERRAREVGAWLAGLPKPVAVFTYGDDMAARVCVMCASAGLVVPEEVAVLGVGNDELACELSPVVLSSIDTAEDERGRQAALLLRRLMDGGAAPPKPIMIPPRAVVARRSTDVLAVPDPVVARAMRFMWDHIEQNLSVGDVAAEAGLSRRSLERAFRRHLGRGINVELRRRRLERCCELLRTTRVPIVELVPKVGFRSADYLHAAFRRAYGTTPRKYRRASAGE